MVGPDDCFVNGWVAGSKIVLLTRAPDGALKETHLPAEWIAYFRRGEVPDDIHRSLKRAAATYKEEGGDWLRVGFRDGDSRRHLCYVPETRDRDTGRVYVNPLASRGVRHYEADLDPIRRLLTDTGAKVQRPRRAYLDLETDSRLPFSRKREMRVLCWALADDQRRVSCGMLREESDRAEAQTLGDLWEALKPYDQVVAWNGGEPDPEGDGFDFPVLLARSQHCGVKADARRWLYLDQMVAFRRMNMHAAGSGEEKQSMKLQSIATAILGRGKKDFDASKTFEAWQPGGESRRRLLDYCVEDTLLLPDIERETGYLDLFATICEVCRLFGNTESLNPTRQMDGFLLRLARERGTHFQSRKWHDAAAEDQQQFKGAYVMQPRTLDARWRQKMGMVNGIARDVHVCDFASLYPSIILTWNMSGETRVPVPVNGPIPEGTCRSPATGVGFATTMRGILCDAILELLRLRKEWSAKQASLPPGTPEWHDAGRRSMAYKVAANSFYGVLGSMYSRYYDRAIAEGVTQNGVWLIQQTISAAEARGWQALYGDTDSVFVVGCTEQEFRDFVQWCNDELYPGILKKQGCKDNYIKLAYEKEFEILVFTAAKRYCGKYAHYKGKRATVDSKPEVKGFEYKRGDASLRARELQREAVTMLLGGEESLEAYHALLTRARTAILEGELGLADVVLSKSLSKPLKEYVSKKKADGEDAAQPPHVVIAKILQARGQDVSEGTRVEYIVADATADDPGRRYLPAEDYRGECDRHYVWESSVYPATQRLLAAAFPGAIEHWEAWARSRPPKTRHRGAKVLDGQLALLADDQVARVAAARPLPPRPA